MRGGAWQYVGDTLNFDGVFTGTRTTKGMIVYDVLFANNLNGKPTLIMNFKRLARMAQLMTKSEVLEKYYNLIGIQLDRREGEYFAYAKNNSTFSTGNKYWSDTNVVTFTFSGEGIESIRIEGTSSDGVAVDKTITEGDAVVQDKTKFANGFATMKRDYTDNKLLSGIIVYAAGSNASNANNVLAEPGLAPVSTELDQNLVSTEQVI